MQRIPLPPYPNGWFAVSHSDELEVGQVKTVQALGVEMVVFRGASGQAFAVDPYCAHLGAHLGVGGRVEGELTSPAKTLAAREQRRGCVE